MRGLAPSTACSKIASICQQMISSCHVSFPGWKPGSFSHPSWAILDAQKVKQSLFMFSCVLYLLWMIYLIMMIQHLFYLSIYLSIYLVSSNLCLVGYIRLYCLPDLSWQ